MAWPPTPEAEDAPELEDEEMDEEYAGDRDFALPEMHRREASDEFRGGEAPAQDVNRAWPRC
jgi:hypothetical protein